jgi:hypothetical protein
MYDLSGVGRALSMRLMTTTMITTQITTPTTAMPTDTPMLLLADLAAAAEHAPFTGGRPSLHALHTLPLNCRQ